MIFELLIGGKVVYDLFQTVDLSDKAEAKNIKAFNRAELAEAEAYKKRKQTDQVLLRLANRKKGVLQTSISQFLDLLEELKKVNFRPGEGIVELYDGSFSRATIAEMHNIIAQVSAPDFSMTNKAMIGKFLIHGMLGAGSALSGTLKATSKYELDEAGVRNRQAGVVEAQSKTVQASLDTIIERADRLTYYLTELNLRFIPRIKQTEEVLAVCGTAAKNYSQTDRDVIQICLNYGKAIKDYLDVPLLDVNGALTQASLQAIETGRMYLEQMDNII